MSMPHLSQLQRDYTDKNVTIIGLTSEDPRNSLEQVKKMVNNKGEAMSYTVAWDADRKTNEAYMKAADQPGLPTSFLIDQDGKIAWIGHPMAADIPLAMVVDGSWDYEKGPAFMKEMDAAKRAIYKSATTDPAHALELLTSFRADYPLGDKGLEGLHFTILAQLPEHAQAAQKLGHKIVAKAIADESVGELNGFAWGLVDPEMSYADRFLDLALLAADKANEFSGGKDPSVLDTVGRVHFWRGDFEQALALQKLAVEHSEGRMKEALQKTVEEYQKALEGERSS